MTWPLQQAKTQFDDLLDATFKDGPQIVTRDGEELAVLVPIDEWKRLHAGLAPTPAKRPTLKEVLMAPFPIVEDMMIPERGGLRHREPPEL